MQARVDMCAVLLPVLRVFEVASGGCVRKVALPVSRLVRKDGHLIEMGFHVRDGGIGELTASAGSGGSLANVVSPWCSNRSTWKWPDSLHLFGGSPHPNLGSMNPHRNRSAAICARRSRPCSDSRCVQSHHISQ